MIRRLIRRHTYVVKSPAAYGGWRRTRINLWTIVGLPCWWTTSRSYEQ